MLLLRFYACILVDLGKRGVLTLVGEISRTKMIAIIVIVVVVVAVGIVVIVVLVVVDIIIIIGTRFHPSPSFPVPNTPYELSVDVKSRYSLTHSQQQ